MLLTVNANIGTLFLLLFGICFYRVTGSKKKIVKRRKIIENKSEKVYRKIKISFSNFLLEFEKFFVFIFFFNFFHVLKTCILTAY